MEFEIAVCNLKMRAGDTSTPEPGALSLPSATRGEFGKECGPKLRVLRRGLFATERERRRSQGGSLSR